MMPREQSRNWQLDSVPRVAPWRTSSVEQQDRLDRRSKASKLLHDNYEFGQVSRIEEPEEALRQSIAEEDKALDAIEAKLKEQFPEFIALAHPEPLSIVDVQAQLHEDEALVHVQRL